MVESALWAKQLALATLEQGSAIDTVLPIMECIGWAGIRFRGVAREFFFILVHRQKYGRCERLSREEKHVLFTRPT
jgi:hypothetical protein